MVASPFRSESWEPRFVVEHYRNEALSLGIALWRSSAAIEFGATTHPVRFVAQSESVLRIAYPASDREHHHGWKRLDTPLPLDQLDTWIVDWLKTATYPDTPWFDGGEARGFCMFWAHFGCEENAPFHTHGELVVLPKWFEIHK